MPGLPDGRKGMKFKPCPQCIHDSCNTPNGPLSGPEPEWKPAVPDGGTDVGAWN